MLRTIFKFNYIVILLAILALGVRLYGLTLPAQPYDIGTYQAWGSHLLAVGPQAFFGSIWSDYLPLPILTFSIPTYLSNLFSLDFTLVFKSFNTIIELALLYLLVRTSKLKNILIISLLFLSPAIIGNTAYWGQVDAIPSLLALVSLSLLATPKDLTTRTTFFAALLYGLAVAYKPIMLLISPILWIVAIKKKQGWQFPFYSGTIFFLTALPFVKGLWDVIHFMYERATEQAGTYPYLSINAWNLWTITGNIAWVPDNLTLLGISGHTLGLFLFFTSLVLIFKSWAKEHFDPEKSYFLSALILIIFYTVTTRMHERHLLFGLPFLIVALINNPKLLTQYLILSVCYILNLYSAFSWVMNNQIWPLPIWVTIITSYATVLTAFSLLITTIVPDIYQKIISLIKSNKLLMVILVFASLLRFVNLSHPQAYIFDEVYHGFTAREYLNNHVEAWEWWTKPPEGVAYEWTHPPVAKYGMVLGMLILGEGELGYRVGSAVMGVLGILGLYLFVKGITNNNNLALLSAFLMTIEGTHIAQSRIAMNDSYMLTFYLWALYAAVKSRWKMTAILYGLALGSKWSALYGAIPLALLYCYNNSFFSKQNFTHYLKHLLFAIRYVLIALAVYVLTFAPFILAGHTWAQWWELHRQMWYYHTTLVATHGYQSTPLQWIFGARPVWYWVQYGDGVISNIYVHANPLILWLGLVALILQLPLIRRFPYFLLYTLYFILFLPWVISPRIMFYYHYLPSAIFLLPILASWLINTPRKIMYFILFSLTLSLVFVSPMLYGYPLPVEYWDGLFKIFPTWK